MGEKIVVGAPLTKGLRNDVTPFVVDNDSFPTLINAYQWRGRVKRKRGTSPLARLTRYFNSTNTSYGSITSFNLSGGSGNLISGFSLPSSANIIPGSVKLTDSTAGNTYADGPQDGTLVGAPSGSGTINYASGAITITSGASNTINAASFRYYTNLPVMGCEDFVTTLNQFPGNIDFDTRYAYTILTTQPYSCYNVSFYKNPPSSGSYTQKTSVTPVSWNGQSYQQFGTINYQGALWTTNGVPVPFVTTAIGMQFKPIITTTVTSGGPPATVSLQITAHGLVVGDYLFINEVVTTTGINYQTGYVTTVTDANNVVVTFPNATIATNGTGGIAQYLTSRSDTTKDCLRWYDGDPTNGNATTPTLNGRKGWVNFCPPLSQGSYSISDLPAQTYYLVGAAILFTFKDRLLFFGPVVQTSSGTPIYLPDTVIYSQNGTPYYTASYTNSPLATVDTPASVTNVFTPLLVPENQTSSPAAFFENQNGFAGFIQAGLGQSITTVSSNQDVLIVGFNASQAKLAYTGNDIVPFNFYIVSSELGSASTFSTINMDQGVFTIGSRGIIATNQVSSARIDLDIPDEVFQIALSNNGFQRVCAQRDYINEWVYFTYNANYLSTINYIFPTQTLQYNYRDNSWGIFEESYTTYGLFRKVTGYTWATIGTIFPTWAEWNEPWNAGSSTLLQPQVIAGNQQGFIVIRDEGTGEADSLYIQSVSGSTITSPNHCLQQGDYFVVSGIIGTLSAINGNIYSVGAGVTVNTFVTSPELPSGTYLGGGLIKRMYVPQIQTKAFPVAWSMARKTRIGVQQYLLTKTASGQITIQVFLSQDYTNPYNTRNVVPVPTTSSAMVYSNILYTCPEGTNLGLTPANINLNMPTGSTQEQIWHRMSTSLIGDTVQLGFTLSDEQMRDTDFASQFSELELHGFIIDVSPSMVLA